MYSVFESDLPPLHRRRSIKKKLEIHFDLEVQNQILLLYRIVLIMKMKSFKRIIPDTSTGLLEKYVEVPLIFELILFAIYLYFRVKCRENIV